MQIRCYNTYMTTKDTMTKIHRVTKNQIVYELDRGFSYRAVAKKFGIDLTTVVDIYWDAYN